MQKNPIFVNPLLRKNSNLCFERKKLAPQPKTLLQKLSHLPTVLLRAHLYFQKVTSLFISALSPPSPSENSFVLPEVALCPLHPLVRWYVPACVLSRFSCVWLCNPMDCSSPDSSVHGILQARILEWVAMPSSRGIFPTQGLNVRPSCLLHWQAGSLPLCHLGKPQIHTHTHTFFLKNILFHYGLS